MICLIFERDRVAAEKLIGASVIELEGQLALLAEERYRILEPCRYLGTGYPRGVEIIDLAVTVRPRNLIVYRYLLGRLSAAQHRMEVYGVLSTYGADIV